MAFRMSVPGPGDGTYAPCSGSAGSESLGPQGKSFQNLKYGFPFSEHSKSCSAPSWGLCSLRLWFFFVLFLIFKWIFLFSLNHVNIDLYYCFGKIYRIFCSSVQFIRSVVSDSLQLYELQHARPPCPSPAPGACSNSCASSRFCHPTISFSVVPFSSCPQSFPLSGSFPMSQLLASGDQSIGVSASTSDLPMNTQDWSPLEWTGWISLQSKGLSRVFSNTTVQKHQFFSAQLSL